MKQLGTFTISLDFELHWGVSENRTVESYHENLSNTPDVVRRLLELFVNYNIRATWATVGMLFSNDKNDLIYRIPSNLPQYKNERLSNYKYVEHIGLEEREDPFHFAASLIKEISKTSGQEVGTHTFSHYYCLAKGADLDSFEADITTAIDIALDSDIDIKSIVFPRNQYSSDHLEYLKSKDVSAYRGNESHWMYQPRNRDDETLLMKICRLIDAYIPISGDNTYDMSDVKSPVNVPSSRFLRPYDKRLAIVDGVRLRRILSEMTYAAKKGRLYHLWWHPHNFGKNMEANFSFLVKILNHYKMLNREFGMLSKNMGDFVSKNVCE